MSARDEILARIRAATADVTIDDPVLDMPVTWAYAQPTPLADVLETFVENILDYRARITRTPASSTSAAIVAALREMGAASVVVPDGVPEPWMDALAEAGLCVVRDDPALSPRQLDEVDAVLTGSAVSMAETGTICLDHRADQGRRALTLVPDRHVCVVRASSVVSDVPEAVARLKDAVAEGMPLTWISGGSATSDIELTRVEGVHGPRQLYVILQTDR